MFLTLLIWFKCLNGLATATKDMLIKKGLIPADILK